MPDRQDTTIYVPLKTKENLIDAHNKIADHPDALPIYATIEAGLDSLLEDYEGDQ